MSPVELIDFGEGFRQDVEKLVGLTVEQLSLVFERLTQAKTINEVLSDALRDLAKKLDDRDRALSAVMAILHIFAFVCIRPATDEILKAELGKLGFKDKATEELVKQVFAFPKDRASFLKDKLLMRYAYRDSHWSSYESAVDMRTVDFNHKLWGVVPLLTVEIQLRKLDEKDTSKVVIELTEGEMEALVKDFQESLKEITTYKNLAKEKFAELTVA